MFCQTLSVSQTLDDLFFPTKAKIKLIRFLIQEPPRGNRININHSSKLISSTPCQLVRHCVLCLRNMLNRKGMKKFLTSQKLLHVCSERRPFYWCRHHLHYVGQLSPDINTNQDKTCARNLYKIYLKNIIRKNKFIFMIELIFWSLNIF